MGRGAGGEWETMLRGKVAVPGRGPTSLPGRLSRKELGTDAQPLRRGEFKHTEEGAKLTALFT